MARIQAGQVDPRLRHQRRQAGDEVEGLEDDVRRAVLGHGVFRVVVEPNIFSKPLYGHSSSRERPIKVEECNATCHMRISLVGKLGRIREFRTITRAF